MMYRPNWQPDRRWQNRPVVRELDDHLVRWLLKMSVGLLVAIAPFGIYLLLMNATLDLSYKASAQVKTLQAVSEEYRNLQNEVARLESLTDIERWATRECGLRQPAPDRVAVIPAMDPLPGDLLARAPNRPAAALRN